MAHLFAFRLEVACVFVRFGNDCGDALDHVNARIDEGVDLFGVVGHEADDGNLELFEDLSGELEEAAIGLVAELEICLNGVEALVLELVGAEFGHEADAAALLLLVEEDASAGAGYGAERELELLAAVAAERVEYVAGKALRVDADDGRSGVDVTQDESDGRLDATRGRWNSLITGFGSIDDAFEAEDAEVSPTGREVGIGDFGHAGEGHSWII